MKIFNWVHRKFHQKDDTIIEPIIEKEMEKHILLKHMVSANTFDIWGDGILSIGTFGLDPLANVVLNTDFEVDEKNNHDEEKELKLAAFGCDLKQNVGSNEEEVEMRTLKLIKDKISLDSKVGIDLEDSELKNKMERRVTLADLFSAEYDEEVKTKKDSCKLMIKCKKKDNDVKDPDGKKTRYSFTKKLINLGLKGDPGIRPIKTVKQMVKRMVKQKIYPSIEEKIQKNEDETIKPAICDFHNKKHGVHEELFLLQNEDTTIGRSQFKENTSVAGVG